MRARAHTHTHTHKYVFMQIGSDKLAASASYCRRRLSGTTPLPSNDISYGVATISKLLKIIFSFAEYRLFYRALLAFRYNPPSKQRH